LGKSQSKKKKYALVAFVSSGGGNGWMLPGFLGEKQKHTYNILSGSRKGRKYTASKLSGKTTAGPDGIFSVYIENNNIMVTG